MGVDHKDYELIINTIFTEQTNHFAETCVSLLSIIIYSNVVALTFDCIYDILLLQYYNIQKQSYRVAATCVSFISININNYNCLFPTTIQTSYLKEQGFGFYMYFRQ